MDFSEVFCSNPMDDHAEKYVYDRRPDENNLYFLLLYLYSRIIDFVSFYRLHINLHVSLVCLSALNSFVLIFLQSSRRRSELLRLPFIIPPYFQICIFSIMLNFILPCILLNCDYR